MPVGPVTTGSTALAAAKTAFAREAASRAVDTAHRGVAARHLEVEVQSRALEQCKATDRGLVECHAGGNDLPIFHGDDHARSVGALRLARDRQEQRSEE